MKYNLKGQVFGRLTILSDGVNRINDKIKCLCICGKESNVKYISLRIGNTKSCGCLKNLKYMNIKHGHTKDNHVSREYISWYHMIARCNKSNHKDYKNYGGRGIIVCERWLKFENFFEDMGERQEYFTLERIDNNGNYCRENCRWATKKEQARNMRVNKILKINGISKTIAEWAEISNIKYRIFNYYYHIQHTEMIKYRLLKNNIFNTIDTVEYL